MRIRKWEKWYWGIVLGLATLVVIGGCSGKELTITIFNKKEVYTEFKDKLKWSLIIATVIIGVCLVIWLIIRFFSNGEGEQQKS